MRGSRLAALWVLALLVLLSAGVVSWPREQPYSRVADVATLAQQIEANPRPWNDRRVLVVGRIRVLFSHAATTPSPCPLLDTGPIHALSDARGTPLLLLLLASAHRSWLSRLGDIPLRGRVVQAGPSWPPDAGASMYELRGRIRIAAGCGLAGLPTAYLSVERVDAAR